MNELTQATGAPARVRCPAACPLDGGENDCMEGRSLAMVYSPCQTFEGIYAPEEGLCRGTIFMELEKPFWGAGRVK